MSTRTLITTISVVAALLAFPVVASAVPIQDPIAVHAKAEPAVPAVAPESPAAASDDGTGTSTVLLIAGLTLVAGAAVGAGGAVARRRRDGALHA